jgi:hypothetical protein
MAWILTPSLVSLRDAFNKRFPRRDKTTDGTIGNQAHAVTTSSHNPDKTGNAEVKDGDQFDEVRAFDADADLNEPGVTMLQVIAAMLADKATLKRLKYIIHNRTIWTANNGWLPRRYTGPSPHTEHAHFNGIFTDDANSAPWPVVLNFGKGVNNVTTADTDGIKAILTGAGSGSLNVANNLHVKLNTIITALEKVQKSADAAAERSSALMDMTDVTTSWSDINPKATQENKLADAIIAKSVATVDVLALAQALSALLPSGVGLTEDDVSKALARVLKSGTDSVPDSQ